MWLAIHQVQEKRNQNNLTQTGIEPRALLRLGLNPEPSKYKSHALFLSYWNYF